MRSMFWRLFISFWLTMIFGGAVSFAVISTFRHLSMDQWHEDMARRLDEKLTNFILLSGQAAEQMYRCGGRSEFTAFVGGLSQGAGIDLTLVGGDNRSITGEPLAEALLQLAKRARKDKTLLIEKEAGRLTVAKELAVPEGETVVVVGAHAFVPPPGMPPPNGKEPPFFARLLPPFFGPGEMVRSAVMLLMVSAVCYLLARSLATPIKKLQRIAQQIAAGDYSARVAGSFGRSGYEIADLGRDFDIMVERTETVINSQKRLLRDISHELRSPLARLNVALELAKKRFAGENDSALIKIGQEADRLNELIGQLLVLSRLESGAEAMITEPVEVSSVLREVAENADFEAAWSGRKVTLLVSAEAVVLGSRELLRRAMENIVRNGVRYTAPDTGVEIVQEVRDDKVQISISDHGPGVPEEDLSHLFEPFYRVAKARERQTGGVGIGLAIALQAVKVHGGSMVVENAVDRPGLMVTVTLPLAR